MEPQGAIPGAVVASGVHISITMSACSFLAKMSHGPIIIFMSISSNTVSSLLLVINLLNSLNISWELTQGQTLHCLWRKGTRITLRLESVAGMLTKTVIQCNECIKRIKVGGGVEKSLTLPGEVGSAFQKGLTFVTFSAASHSPPLHPPWTLPAWFRGTLLPPCLLLLPHQSPLPSFPLQMQL